MAHQLPETPIIDEKLSTLFSGLYTEGTVIVSGLVEEKEEYRPRTLGAHNIARLSILPIFPSFSPSTPGTQSHLLLSNVPGEIYFER